MGGVGVGGVRKGDVGKWGIVGRDRLGDERHVKGSMVTTQQKNYINSL